MKKIFYSLALLSACLLAVPTGSFAEEPGDGAGAAFSSPEPSNQERDGLLDIDPGPTDPQDVPIDGGLGFLLIAGAAYGVKKYREAAAVKSLELGV